MAEQQQTAPNNPSAFPGGNPSRLDRRISDGMTLRDWFAGQAPAIPLAFAFRAPPSPPAAWTRDYDVNDEARYEADLSAWVIAREVTWRYAYADAMLAARIVEPGK